MPEVSIGPSKLIFTYRSINPEVPSLVPRMRLDLDVHYAPGMGQPGYNILLSFGKSELKLKTRSGDSLYAGMFTPGEPLLTLAPNSSNVARLYVDLDHYKLAQIEKVREGGDLRISIDLFVVAELQQQPPVKYFNVVSIEARIPKSDWVEEFLPRLKYKEVLLLEIPKIEKPEFSDVVARINDAWKQYSMGEYDKTLTECRKALEALTGLIKSKGFERKIQEEGKERTVPDWEKVVGHKEIGNILEVFTSKLFGFVAPGSHYGKSINREDAELAIMFTHGLTNYIARKMQNSHSDLPSIEDIL